MITRTLQSIAIGLLVCSTAQAADLTVTVTDIRTMQGSLGLSLVDSEAAWSGEAKAVKRQLQPVQGTEIVFRFTDLPPGDYAASVMHDENGNGKLDSNFMGMPTEGYGFSNNPKVLRKPTFEEARFKLGAKSYAIIIRLR